MTPLQWVNLFAQFAEIGIDVVDSFLEAHPELQDPPPSDAEAEIYSDFNQAVAAKFPTSDQPDE